MQQKNVNNDNKYFENSKQSEKWFRKKPFGILLVALLSWFVRKTNRVICGNPSRNNATIFLF